MLAENAACKEPSSALEFLELLPKPAKIAIPSKPQRQWRTKQEMRSASQKINATLILPQTFVVTQPSTDNKVGTSHNVVQRILPPLQLGAQDASKIPQSDSGRVTNPASCPTTSVSATGPPTETLEEAGTSKRRHKPTMKAQALMQEKKNKVSKKQPAKPQQNSGVTQTVAVLPQTTAWLITPTVLVPITEIQIQAPKNPGHQNQTMPNNVQIVFQPQVIVDQSSSVAPPSAMRPSNPTSDLPGNNNSSLTAGSNLDQKPEISVISNDHPVSSLPSSNFSSVISGVVTDIPSVPQVLTDTKVPTSVTESVAQIPPSKTACSQNKPLTLMNPVLSLGPVSSSPVGTSEKLTPSCISDATNRVPNVSSVSPLSSTPSIPSVQLLNISGPGTISGPQSQNMTNPVSQMVLQQPIIINQNGSLALINTAGSFQSNAPPAPTASVTRVPPDSAVPKTKKSHPASSTEGPVIPSYFLIPPSVPSSALDGTSHVIPQSIVVTSPVGVSVGDLPTNQLCVNPRISPMTTSYQILPQTVGQQMPPQAKKQTIQKAANPRPKQMTLDPSLMFIEPPAQVKHWLKGKGGITLPGLEVKMPYLPPFVSSISTLTTLLEGRDSFLKSAVQLLPEEHRDNSDEVKIAAVRKMVSEKFKTTQAYLLLKARFLSCFTLPALLATINPCREAKDALDEENDLDRVTPKQFGEDHLL